MDDFKLPPSASTKGPAVAATVPPKKKAQPSFMASEFSDKSEPAPEQGAAESSEQKTDSKEPTYSKEELLRIFDELVFSGDYSETFNIRGKLAVTLRARTAEEINAIQKSIDSSNWKLISSVETMRSLLNLQYALSSFGNKDLTLMNMEARGKFIEGLPGPMVGMLIGLLGKFDHKVSKACEIGEENF